MRNFFLKQLRVKLIVSGVILMSGCVVIVLVWIETGPPASFVRQLGSTNNRVIVRFDEPRIVEFLSDEHRSEVELSYPIVSNSHLIVSPSGRFAFALINKPKTTAIVRIEIPPDDNDWSKKITQTEILDGVKFAKLLPEYRQHVITDIFSSSYDGSKLLLMVRVFGDSEYNEGPHVVLADIENESAKIILAE